MRVHRFYLPEWSEQSTISITDEGLIHQWLRVFRFEVGSRVVLCNGKNEEVAATITEIQKRSVTVRTEKKTECHTELSRPLVLACAFLKRENFDLVIQKATELGVTEIQPLITDRTIKDELKRTRLETIAKEAMEQSGRGRMPVIHEPKNLKQFLLTASSKATAVLDAGGRGIPEVITSLLDPIIICIGPEGGWSEEERAFFQENGFRIASLGTRVLRAETAVIASLAIVTSLRP
jgi:16S rRNA (uracil1498-N3)-methyltransferase